jgi:hypothetical protein
MRLDLAVRAAPVVLGLVVLGLVVLGPVVLGPVAPAGRVVLGLADPVVLAGLMGPVAPVAQPLPDLEVLVVPAVLVLVLVARVDPVGLMGRAAPVDLARVARVVPAALAVLDRVDPVDLTDRTALVGPVVQDRMGLAAPGDLEARMARVGPAGLNTAAPVAPMARVALGDPVVPGDLVGLNTVVQAGPVAPAGRHRRPMCNTVTMTVVARNGVVRGTRRTASALRVTARPHLRPRTDSDGMAGLLPERRRPTGTVHRLLVVGTVRRPPAAGTNTGTDRRTTSVGGRRTMARSTTTATTPHRSSTRCSVAGASGSSARGSRCTDLSPA